MNPLASTRILAPVDFSKQSLASIDTAVDIAGQANRVHLVHVLPELSPTDPGVIWETVDDETRSEHVCDALHRHLDARGHQGVQVHTAFGDPGAEIVKVADAIDAGLIVMSSHGRSGLERLLLGSVADRVIRLAHCPVLVLRPDPAESNGS